PSPTPSRVPYTTLVRSYIDRGYTVVKKTIGGASLDEDLRRIDSILSVLQDGQKLAVDANGRFDMDTAIAYAKALSQYDLFWYEEDRKSTRLNSSHVKIS